MRCPTLAELPPPPSGKQGWPWTEETPPLSAAGLGSGRQKGRVGFWPQISIVTPSYNQGAFLEETIRSVLLQGYPHLEYIIIDGGSDDQSLDVIRRYAPWLAYWVSEPDRGQSHAINKGLACSTGEILAWLNSDDFYLPGTLGRVAEEFHTHPELSLLYGDALFVDAESTPLWPYRGRETTLLEKLEYWKGWHVPQPTTFFRRDLYLRIGPLEETFHYGLDYEYFLRAALVYPFHYLPATLATYRRHEMSKTGEGDTNRAVFHAECRRAVTRHVRPTSLLYWQWRIERILLTVRQRLHPVTRMVRRLRKAVA
ncbi:MAG: glycosyltransferase [Nitrospinota bacterium]|nr:MAG: glycosyltransferase [Nitrospinota bacterium]